MNKISTRSRVKTAFVFAGGGSFGAIQVGMLRALAEHGVRPDLVLGTSVGAMNAAYFAGCPTLDGVQALERVWRGLKRHDVFPVTWRSLWGFARRGDFLVSSDGLRRLCRENLSYKDLRDAPVPVHIVATDVLTGEAVVISDGAAEDAIVASAAIPAAFAPVRVKDRLLVDGALTSNTPIRAAVALGAERIIVLSTGHPCVLDKAPHGAIALALHALTLLISRQLHIELHGLDRRVETYIVPTPCPLAGSPYDFSRTGELIDRAAESTAAWLAKGGLERKERHHRRKRATSLGFIPAPIVAMPS